MDKILKKETVEYLKTFGISDNEIFKIKKDKLKDYAIQKLSLAIEAVKQEDFSLTKENTFESVAGDNMDDDDTCINFGGIKDGVLNIKDLFHIIKYCKEINEGKRVKVEDYWGGW